MNEPIINHSLDSLLEALISLPSSIDVNYVYRIYYDPDTRDGILKSLDLLDGTFIEVTKDVYDSIEFCPNYRITKSNTLVKKRIDFSSSKLLQCSNTGYRTVKDNNIFIVGDDFTGEVDHWTTRDSNEQTD